MAKKRHRALIKGGLWFVLKTSPRRVMVVDPNVPKSGRTFRASTNVINHYDLRIWAAGYLARESNG